MIDGNKFIKTVKNFFSFLITEFNFQVINEKIRGNVFYDVHFGDKIKIVSVSYENIEDYLLIIVFVLQNGEMPDYDNKTQTLHLGYLNKILLAKIDKNEIISNNEYFNTFQATEGLEKKLLKSAKELRLCLKHFDELWLCCMNPPPQA